MEDVILNFYIDGFGVSGGFEVNTGIGKDEWGEMKEAERDQIATEYYNDQVTWGYEAV